MTGATALTPLTAWTDALAGTSLPDLDPAAVGRLVVVAAHPDDETLAASGFMQAVRAAGNEVELVVATDGEAAFPDADRAARDSLRRVRRAELRAALEAADLSEVPVRWLGLPDSALRADELAEQLSPLLREAHTYLAPWCGDPHPDHVAAGRAAASAAPVHVHGWGYPIWMWAWCSADDRTIPWDRARLHRLTASQRTRKHRSVEQFESQLEAPPGGGPPVLPAEVRRYFETDHEIFFRIPPTTSAPVGRFEELYGRGDGDPWETRSGWYEQRKRAITLACLPRPRYRHAAEPGCGLGELTHELATRCDRIDSSDYSARAVAATRSRIAGRPGVGVAQLALPDERCLPDGIDLAVLSEVLYYLDPADQDSVLNRLATAVAPGGDVVVVHWRGWPAEAPSDAERTHARLRRDPRFSVTVEHTDVEFLLLALRRR